MRTVWAAFAGLGLALTSYANPASSSSADPVSVEKNTGYLVNTDTMGRATYYKVPMAIRNENDADLAIDRFAQPEFVVTSPQALPSNELNQGTSDEAWRGGRGRGWGWGWGYGGGYYGGRGYGPGWGYGGGWRHHRRPGWGYYGRGW